MENDNEAERKKRLAFKNNPYCSVCGIQIFSDSVRCPDCGRLCCTNCFVEFEDKEIDIRQMLCKFCHHKRVMEEDKKMKERTLFLIKVVLVFVALVVIASKVLRWF
jgi:hypothetical protein